MWKGLCGEQTELPLTISQFTLRQVLKLTLLAHFHHPQSINFVHHRLLFSVRKSSKKTPLEATWMTQKNRQRQLATRSAAKDPEISRRSRWRSKAKLKRRANIWLKGPMLWKVKIPMSFCYKTGLVSLENAQNTQSKEKCTRPVWKNLAFKETFRTSVKSWCHNYTVHPPIMPDQLF